MYSEGWTVVFLLFIFTTPALKLKCLLSTRQVHNENRQEKHRQCRGKNVARGDEPGVALVDRRGRGVAGVRRVVVRLGVHSQSQA